MLEYWYIERGLLTTVSRFSRQNDVGLRALKVLLWENLVLAVVLILESKALYNNSAEDETLLRSVMSEGYSFAHFILLLLIFSFQGGEG